MHAPRCQSAEMCTGIRLQLRAGLVGRSSDFGVHGCDGNAAAAQVRTRWCPHHLTSGRASSQDVLSIYHERLIDLERS
jgi:hypothetical protein